MKHMVPSSGAIRMHDASGMGCVQNRAVCRTQRCLKRVFYQFRQICTARCFWLGQTTEGSLFWARVFCKFSVSLSIRLSVGRSVGRSSVYLPVCLSACSCMYHVLRLWVACRCLSFRLPRPPSLSSSLANLFSLLEFQVVPHSTCPLGWRILP